MLCFDNNNDCSAKYYTSLQLQAWNSASALENVLLLYDIFISNPRLASKGYVFKILVKDLSKASVL